jgi:hypothetical protein
MRLVAHIVAPLLLPAAVALCVAACIAVPRGFEAARLLYAQDDPVRLADYAIEKALSPEVARVGIENALAADDADLAASFLALARDRAIAVDPPLAARVEAAGTPAAQAVHTAKSFAYGLVTGAPDDLAGLAGTAAGDLFVFGDIRDAVREGAHMVRGEPADELILGLAGAGIAATAATYATLGSGTPARLGLSLVKAARKTGRLAAPMAEWMTRSVREAVDTTALGTALTKASFAAPAVAFRAARDAVKVERAEGLVTVVRDVGRVQGAAGTRAALEGLKLAEGPQDVARLARLAGTKGGKTRAILKLAGRGAFALTAAAFALFSWLFAAAGGVRLHRSGEAGRDPGPLNPAHRRAGRSRDAVTRSVRRTGTSRSAWSTPGRGSGRCRASGASRRRRNSRPHRIPRCRTVPGLMILR